MYLNCHTYYSLRYGTIMPERLLTLASENNFKALALTDINNTSACLDFVRLSEKYKIKPVLGVDFRNGAAQQFILLAKNNHGFHNINTYLSKHLHDSSLKFSEQAPQLDDTFVIYPYKQNNIFNLKPNEFIGVSVEEIKKLRFSYLNRFTDKLVIQQQVTIRNKRNITRR